MEYCPECRRYENIGAVLGDDEGCARYAGIVVEGDVQLQKGAAMPPRPQCARNMCKVRVSRRSRKPGTVWSECCTKECDLLWRRGAIREGGPYPPGYLGTKGSGGRKDALPAEPPVQNVEFAAASTVYEVEMQEDTSRCRNCGKGRAYHDAQGFCGLTEPLAPTAEPLAPAVTVNVQVNGAPEARNQVREALERHQDRLRYGDSLVDDLPPLFTPPLRVQQVQPESPHERLVKMLAGLEQALQNMDEDTDSFTVVVTVFRDGTRRYGQPIFTGKPAGGASK